MHLLTQGVAGGHFEGLVDLGKKDVLKAAADLLRAFETGDPEDDVEEVDWKPAHEVKEPPWYYRYMVILCVVMIVIAVFAYQSYSPPPDYAIWDTGEPDMGTRGIPLEAGTYELWVYNYKPKREWDFEVSISRSYSDWYALVKTEANFTYTVDGKGLDPPTYWNMGDFEMEKNGTITLQWTHKALFLIIPDRYPEQGLFLAWSYLGLFGGVLALANVGIFVYFKFHGRI